MASAAEPLSSSAVHSNALGLDSHLAKSLPILSTSANSADDRSDPMDTTQNQTSFELSGADGEETNELTPTAQHDQQQSINGGAHQPVGAAAAAQQPKVVQTAFIHKLYNMLEDQSIRHLIAWSDAGDSFVMSPSSEFSKVLAHYFKHTNISSFVRQLNMYGFHKVSDVFHTGSSDSPLWEFKHGGGNFKRGDLVGLREIKRRASRHALIHRDSFSAGPKMPTPAQPGTAMEPQMQDPIESRLSMLEWNTQEMYARLTRTEEAYTAMTTKCQALLEGLSRCHHWNQELCSHLLSLIAEDNPIHKDVSATRQEISRYVEQLRNIGDTQDSLFANKPSFFQNNNFSMELPLPLSPRQRPFDDSRRPSLQTIRTPSSFRAPAAPQPPMSPRRYGSIGTGSGAYSPAYNRPAYLPPPPPPQPQQHPLASMTSPPVNLARRHTSADIRVHGWQGGQPPSQYNHGSSPFASGESSSAWPSSPRQTANPGDQHLRDALAQYELPRASNTGSRQPSPPPPHETGAHTFTSSFGGSYANPNDAGWQIPGARYPFKGLETSRRSSMASNVHSLLNPADTAEREGEDEGPDERKRKRMQ